MKQWEQKVSQKRLDKEHNNKSKKTNHINFPDPVPGNPSGYQLQCDPCKDPSEECAEGIGYQIVDVCCPICENLKGFDQQGGEETEEDRPEKGKKTSPEYRKEKPQGKKQQNIQYGIGQIRKHVGKGHDVIAGIKPDISDIGQSDNSEHTRQIHRKENVAGHPDAVVEIVLIQIEKQRYQKDCRNRGVKKH